MKLYLMRHAIAVAPAATGFSRDSMRPLTADGIEQAHDVAEGLKRLKILPDLIVASPYLRAVQTAEQAVRVFGKNIPLKESSVLRPESEPQETSQTLKSFGIYDKVLCVGHEPHMSRWLAWLVSARGALRCLMKKGGVACVETEHLPPSQGSATLRWLLTPKQLSIIGQGGRDR